MFKSLMSVSPYSIGRFLNLFSKTKKQKVLFHWYRICDEGDGLVAVNNLGDNCIQNVHLGRYIVGYMVGNFVLQRRVLNMVIPILMHFLTFICHRHSILHQTEASSAT